VVLLEVRHPLTEDDIAVMHQSRENQAAEAFEPNAVVEDHLNHQRHNVDDPGIDDLF